MNYTPKFPKNPSNDTEVLDRYGNRWQYDLLSNAWISKGVIKAYSVATEEQSGLVTPEVFNKLQNLRTYSKMYDLKSSLKLNPGKDAYWYYFRSADKLIRFKPEADNILRIEVDKGRLYQILLKNQRVGPRGLVGDDGDPGDDGLPGLTVCDNPSGEPEYEPSVIEGNRLDFAIYTPVPLVKGGPVELPNDHVPTIAVRIFRITKIIGSVAADQFVTFDSAYKNALGAENYNHTRNIITNSIITAQGTSVCGIKLSRVYKIAPKTILTPAFTIDIDPVKGDVVSVSTTSQVLIDQKKTIESIRYNKDTSIVCGSIYLAKGSWESNTFTVRSRQRGPDGLPGEPGESTLIIESSNIDNSNIEANCPIVNVRYDEAQDIIYTFCSGLSNDVCVSKVAILNDMSSLTTGSILDSKFAAAQMILDECKYINIYQPEIQSSEIPELDFDVWEPQDGCVTQRHFDRHKFDWFANLKGTDCSPYGVYNSKSKDSFPYKIITANIPPEDECCQEDWFYCPNIQDGPCEGEPPSPPPSPSPVAAAKASIIHDMKGSGVGTKSLNLGMKKWNIRS